MAVLAVLPVHAIYAGFVLRESLVALMSILAVWTLTEVWMHAVRAGRRSGAGRSRRGSAAGWPCCRARPGCAPGWRGSLRPGRPRPAEIGSLSALGPRRRCAVCLPWAWATLDGIWITFLFDYTAIFEYNFSWTVHHYEKGQYAAVAVLHASKPARDRAGEDQVAALDRRVLRP